MSVTEQQYNETPDIWGDNQFTTLESIIDNIILLADDDSYFKKIKRFRLEIWGKLGLKKLKIDIKPDNKVIMFELAPSKIFPAPQYMVNWSRASVITKCNTLHELAINNRPQITEYLQDCDGEILFDECTGSILTGEVFDAQEGICCYKFDCKTDKDCGCQEEFFEKSWVKYNRKEGYFTFSDDLIGRKIALEFRCGGLEELDACDVKVHDDLELTLMRFIQYNALMGKRNTPDRSWETYYAMYKLEKKRSKSLLGNKITLNQIIESVSLRYN